MPSDASTAFFSYSRDDSEFALRLAGDLKAAGANVWLDQLDIAPGQRWARAVEEALENAQRVLVILSPTSVASTNVEDEVAFALDEHKTIIPVFYRDCKVPFQLRPFQYVDFRADYGCGLQIMLKTLAVEHPTHDSGAGMIAPTDGRTTIATAEDRQQAPEQFRFVEEERERQKKQREAEQARLAEEKRARAERERKAAAEQARLEQEQRQRQATAERERLAKEQAEAERAAAARQAERDRTLRAQAEAPRPPPGTGLPAAGEMQAASGGFLGKVVLAVVLCAAGLAGLVWLIASRKQSPPTNSDVTATQPLTAPEPSNEAPSKAEAGKSVPAGSLQGTASDSLPDTSGGSSRFLIGGPSDAQTVLDSKTGLMWTRKDYWDVEGKYAKSWYDAMDWAKKMNAATYAGYSDWTVPTVAQYRTINSSKADREVYARTFDKTDATDFWSSNTPNKNVASYVDFGLKEGGWAVSGSRINQNVIPPSVRLVRSK